jgi:hypothetical protein
MASATERRVDDLVDESLELETRVHALEKTVAQLRTEIKAAAHELREDSNFMKPYSQSVANHVADHWIGTAGRALIKYLAIIIVGIVLFLAGRWGILK